MPNQSTAVDLLFPLTELFLPERDQLEAQPLRSEDLPQPYRRLLDHRVDMTSTLESFCGEPILIRVLELRRRGQSLLRRVALIGADSGRLAELGAIEIHLECFAAAVRRQILQGHLPLGGILAEQGVKYRSRTRAFLRLDATGSLFEGLVPQGATLFGRQNTLIANDGRLLAEVLELLPPLEPNSATVPVSLPEDVARHELGRRQLRRLRRLLGELSQSNSFYAPRLRAAGLDQGLDRLEDLSRLPPTTKAELVDDQLRQPPYGTNLTYPLERYSRFHQTSGTSGQPLRWLDTPESFAVLREVWRRVFDVAGVDASDRLLFPFSFGPFLGFWVAFDAAAEMGCLCLSGGGVSTVARLRMLLDNQVTVVCATPTYAVHLAEVAAQQGIDLPRSSVERLIVAGEPGGSVPATRQRLAELWGAEVFDHHGMTEVGPVSFPNPEHPGVLHIAEDSFLAEVVDPETLRPVAPGEVGELLLTTLRRYGSPLLRYRTGDLVRPSKRSSEQLGIPELALEGGILARADDMRVVRGVNLFPSAVEQVVRSQDGIGEYQVRQLTRGAMMEIEIHFEPVAESAVAADLARNLETALRDAFQLRIPVQAVERGSLPRFELKAKRWVEVG